MNSLERIMEFGTAKGGGNATQQQQQLRKKKLGDGCYHVFLDVGSNIGEYE